MESWDQIQLREREQSEGPTDHVIQGRRVNIYINVIKGNTEMFWGKVEREKREMGGYGRAPLQSTDEDWSRGGGGGGGGGGCGVNKNRE